MQKKKIVVALGGNALGNGPLEQIDFAKIAASSIVDLIEEGNTVVVTHGNGPQVGMIDLVFEQAAKTQKELSALTLSTFVAMSQTYIGFDLERAIKGELRKRGMDNPVSVLMTQTIVEKDDPAFNNPTKPIGSFYQESDIGWLEERGYVVKEDAGRGYRRVVASPKPIDIEEKESIKILVDAGHIVIAGGGGGIPVVREGNCLKEVSAVVDKDWASAKIAGILDADMLVILTAVEKVAINFRKENEELLDHINVAEAERYIEEGHFAEGSMLPKVKATIDFVSGKEGRKALITKLETAKLGLQGKTGTVIEN